MGLCSLPRFLLLLTQGKGVLGSKRRPDSTKREGGMPAMGGCLATLVVTSDATKRQLLERTLAKW